MSHPQALNKPYVIAKLPNKTAEILIYEAIGASFFEDGITAKQFAQDLAAIGDVRRIDVRINSPGGSVNDGLAIYNALVAHPATVVAHVDGIAFSMASVVAMAAQTVTMAENALMMIHNPRWVAEGDAREMRRTADLLDRYRRSLVKAYAKKTNLSDDAIIELMDAETFFDANEAIAQGFADQITEPLNVAAYKHLDNLPEGVVVPPDVAERFSILNRGGYEMTVQTPQQPTPATLAELKALAGATSDFIVAQLEANATVSSALNALNAQLADDLRVARHELTQERQARASETPEPTPAPAPEPTPAPAPADDGLDDTPAAVEGVRPLGGNRTPGEAERRQPEPTALELFGREFKRLRAEGVPADQAVQTIYKEHPDWKKERLVALGR